MLLVLRPLLLVLVAVVARLPTAATAATAALVLHCCWLLPWSFRLPQPRCAAGPELFGPRSAAGAAAPAMSALGVTEEDSVDVLFHGTAYNLSATVSAPDGGEPVLALDLEDATTGA